MSRQRLAHELLYARGDKLHFRNSDNAARWAKKYGGHVYVPECGVHGDWIRAVPDSPCPAFVLDSPGDWTEDMYEEYLRITGTDLRAYDAPWPRMAYEDTYVPDPVNDAPSGEIERMPYTPPRRVKYTYAKTWDGPDDIRPVKQHPMYDGPESRIPSRDPSFMWFVGRFGLTRMLDMDWQPYKGEFPDQMALDFMEFEGGNAGLSNYADNFVSAVRYRVKMNSRKRKLNPRADGLKTEPGCTRFVLMPDGTMIRVGKNTDRFFGGVFWMSRMNHNALARARKRFGLTVTQIMEAQTRMLVVDFKAGRINIHRTPTDPQIRTLRKCVSTMGMTREQFRAMLVPDRNMKSALPTRQLQYAFLNAYASAVFAPRDGT